MVVKHNLELDVRNPVVMDTGLVMIQNDCKANVLQITMLGVTDWTGVTAVMKYKRSDGLSVIDSIHIEDGTLNHVVPMAALNVSGALFCEVALFKEDVRITSSQLRILVREEIGEDPSFVADPRYPILDALIKDTKAINGVAKEEAERAKEEADRAASIDVYTKAEADTLLAQKADKGQEEWRVPILMNGWGTTSEPSNPPRYKKDSLGFVVMCGRVSGGEAHTVAFVLPEGYRPSHNVSFMCAITSNASSYGRVNIFPTGECSIYLTDSSKWIDLVTVRFEAKR